MGYKRSAFSILVALSSSILAISYFRLHSLTPLNTFMLPSLARKMASQTTAQTLAQGTTATIGNLTARPISREVTKKVFAVETPEGAGAVVRRSIGTPQLRNFSPFLMLDHFKVAEGAGFPDHPHRGQATVTYMLDGQFQHEDFCGHAGKIGPGDLQWMIAGRGIMHAEMPIHRDAQGKKLPDPVGLQLWVDLPKANKMDEASYQEFSKDKVPLAEPRADQPVETEGQGWHVKVIAGESHGVKSPVRTPERGGCDYYDIRLDAPGARIFQQIPTGYNAFIYSFGDANIKVGDASSTASQQTYEPYNTLVLSNKAQISDPKVDPSTVPQENGVWVEHAGKQGQEARLVLIAGEPLDQRVFQHGPFVMTSREEIMQTFMDYQSGSNGFERAPGWKSKIGGR